MGHIERVTSHRSAVLLRKLRSAGFHAKCCAGIGSLPDAIGIGATKGGTSSLFHYLVQIPGIVGSRVKEVHYFDHQHRRPLAWYAAHFPALRGGVALECTPNYLHHPEAPHRAGRIVPGARLLVLLRNPVERAYSHYNHARRAGVESLSFDDAIAREEGRQGLSGEALAGGYEPEDWASSYVRRGFYAAALNRWFKHYPRDQFLIRKSEDFFRDPQGQVDEVCAFLGVRPSRVPRLDRRNGGTYPAMSRAARRKLELTFEEPNRTLEDLIGISW